MEIKSAREEGLHLEVFVENPERPYIRVGRLPNCTVQVAGKECLKRMRLIYTAKQTNKKTTIKKPNIL